MNIQEAIDMFGRTRTRLLQVLEKCDDNILDFKPEMKMPKGGSFHKARSILRHVACAESHWLQSKVLGRKEYPHYDFSNKNLKEIVVVLQDVRKETLNWLNENKNTDLNKPYSLKAKRPASCILYHLAEHEAHHLGQLCMIADMAGIVIPWVGLKMAVYFSHLQCAKLEVQ